MTCLENLQYVFVINNILYIVSCIFVLNPGFNQDLKQDLIINTVLRHRPYWYKAQQWWR